MSLTLKHSAAILCDFGLREGCEVGKAIDLAVGSADADTALAYFESVGWDVVEVDGKRLHACPACKERRKAVA